MDDLIRKTDAIKATWQEPIYTDPLNVLTEVRDRLEAIPSADRPQGEWKRRLVDNGFNADWVCSECGYRVKTDFVSFNFCPNCGAKMKGKDDEDNH